MKIWKGHPKREKNSLTATVAVYKLSHLGGLVDHQQNEFIAVRGKGLRNLGALSLWVPCSNL